MRRVLFVTESRGFSGGARQLLSLAGGLAASGWELLLACPGDGETSGRARRQGLETVDFIPHQDYDLPAAWRLARLVCERGVDLLHAHHPKAHAVGLLSQHLSRRRPVFVVTRRVSFPIPRNPFSRLKYRSRRIDSFVAVAHSVRGILLDAGVEPARVAVIPSAVDLERFSPRPRDPALAAALGLEVGTPVVGLVANYGSWKGQGVFLEAAARLKASGLKAVYLFAGRDTDSPELKSKALAAGLEPAELRFLGFCEDAPALLSLLDVSVSASTAGEGLSGSIRESLAMGVPVAAADVGGSRELVQDGVTGRLVPASDPAALAAAVLDLLQDRARARRMAEAGRIEVSRRFGRERMVEATAALYLRLLSGAGAQAAERAL